MTAKPPPRPPTRKQLERNKSRRQLQSHSATTPYGTRPASEYSLSDMTTVTMSSSSAVKLAKHNKYHTTPTRRHQLANAFRTESPSPAGHYDGDSSAFMYDHDEYDLDHSERADESHLVVEVHTPTTTPTTPPRSHAAPNMDLELTPEEGQFHQFSRYLGQVSTHPHYSSSHTETHYQKFANDVSGLYNLTDEQLACRFEFEREVGYGQWGSVWMCRLLETSMMRRNDPSARLGRAAAMNGGVGARGRVAIKLAHREGSPSATQRVHALWSEMKIIRSLRHETHPSIIEFEAFVITPTTAAIVMPFLAQVIPMRIPIHEARPYFRQLTSAIGYLHERGITHNDIKPANIVMNHNNVPVLVDFGFARKHEPGPGRFLSIHRTGTPEYLDPQRVVGQPHDERHSDVWSLGVTFYEILVGRTPFEAHEEEVFQDEDALHQYWLRTREGVWLGDYDMPKSMEHLLHYMICPDPMHRYKAMEAYHDPALHSPKSSLVDTPTFVREAVYVPDPDLEEAYVQVLDSRSRKLKNIKSDVADKRKPSDRDRVPTPLGETIKQETVVAATRQLRPAKTVTGLSDAAKKVVKQKKAPRKDRRHDPTPKNNRITEIEQKLPRVSPSERVNLPRPASASALLTSVPDRSNITHLNVSDHSASPSPAKSREEAVLRTMRSLEGDKPRVPIFFDDIVNESREAAHQRALRSLEGGNTAQPEMVRKSRTELRRSTGSDRLSTLATVDEVDTILPPTTPPRIGPTAPKLDLNLSSRHFLDSPVRQRIVSADAAIALRSSPQSKLRPRDSGPSASPSRLAKQSTAPTATGPKEDNLDRLAEWARMVDNYVEDCRKARAEGRQDPPMPSQFPATLGSMTLSAMSPIPPSDAEEAEFGTFGTPKEIQIKEFKRPARRAERPTVAQVFGRFTGDAKPPFDSEAANKNHSLRRMGGRIPTRKAEIDASSPSSSATLVNERSQSIHDHNAERTSWRNSKFLSPPATYTPLAPEAPSGPPRMTKPSSTSLREKARALFSHDEKVLAAKTLPRARGRASVDIDTQTPRPSTPGGYSVFSRERKGLLKLFRRG